MVEMWVEREKLSKYTTWWNAHRKPTFEEALIVLVELHGRDRVTMEKLRMRQVGEDSIWGLDRFENAVGGRRGDWREATWSWIELRKAGLFMEQEQAVV